MNREITGRQSNNQRAVSPPEFIKALYRDYIQCKGSGLVEIRPIIYKKRAGRSHFAKPRQIKQLLTPAY